MNRLIPVIFCLLILLCFPLNAQKNSNNYEEFYYCNSIYNEYPMIDTEFYFHNYQNMEGKYDLTIFEDSSKCEIISINKTSPRTNIHLHIFADFYSYSNEDFQLVVEQLSLLNDANDIKFIPSFYKIRKNSFQESSVSEIQKSYLENYSFEKLNYSEVHKFISAKINWQGEFHILIFLLKEISEKEINLINNIGESFSKADNVWFGVIYKDNINYSKENYENGTELYLKRVLFLEDLDNLTFKVNESILYNYNKVLSGFYRVKYIPKTKNVYKQGREFVLKNNQNNKYVEFSTIAPIEILNKQFAEYTLEKTEQLLVKGRINKASDFLLSQFQIYSAEVFNSYVMSLLTKVSEDSALVSGFDALFYLSEFEKKMEIETAFPKKYNDIKSQIIYKKLLSQQNDDNYELKYNLAKTLYDIKPDNREYEVIYWEEASEYFESISEFWKSVHYLNFLSKTKKNSNYRKELINAFDLAIEKDIQEKNFSNIYINAKKYKSILANSFNRRYYYALSCEYQNDLHESIENYEWLIYNWTNTQSQISWENLIEKLQELYNKTYSFNDAIYLNQRIYKKEGNKRALNSVIINIRAKYLKPIVDLYSQLSSSTTEYLTNPSIQLPKYIKSINIVNSTGNVIKNVYGSTEITDFFNAPKSSNIIISKSQDIVYIFSANNNSQLVLGFDLSSDHTVESILSILPSKKLLAEPWNELIRHEEEIAIRLLSGVVSSMLELDLAKNKNINFNKYFEVLSKGELAKYIVLHGDDGSVRINKNFSLTNGKFDNNLWQRSLSSKAFFKQQIEYDSETITDVATGIYENNRWIGVLRIGFKNIVQ